MSENKIESVDGFNGHLQQLGDIINYLDGLQMGEVREIDEESIYKLLKIQKRKVK